MARTPIPTWTFALTIVRCRGRFLLVKERKHGGGWYLPGGRVEPGETLVEGAVREAEEEAGLAIRIEGIHRLQYTPQPDGSCRLRVLFIGSPAHGETVKTEPDEHTDGAAWFTLDQVRKLPLRGWEVVELFEEVERGGAVAPISLLEIEGR